MKGLADVKIIRIDGAEEDHRLQSGAGLITRVRRLIGADCCDAVNLRDGRMMIVDDTGLIDGKPTNKKATDLYWSIYPMARESHQPIAGDVAIATDADFA